MKTTDVITDFVGFLADIQDSFRHVQLSLQENVALHSVSIAVIPSKGKPSDYADKGVIVCVSLNAELRKPIDADKKAIGMSLLLRHSQGAWIAEAEVGWSGEDIGWDQFDSKEAEALSVDQIMVESKLLVEWMSIRLKSEIEKLFP